MAPKKLSPDATKKLIDSLREKNSKALSSTQFRHEALEAQKLYAGDPISMFDWNAKTVMPSLGHRWNYSAHAYNGLQLPNLSFNNIGINPLRIGQNNDDDN